MKIGTKLRDYKIAEIKKLSKEEIEEINKLSLFDRAIIVINLNKLAKQEKKKDAENKRKWINKQRSAFNPGEKRPCNICGRYQSVSHAHHIVPLHSQYGTDKVIHDYVWLCPTHHEGVHLLIDKCKSVKWHGVKFSVFPEWDGFNDDERSMMTEIAHRGIK